MAVLILIGLVVAVSLIVLIRYLIKLLGEEESEG
jgi:hypothetical protein